MDMHPAIDGTAKEGLRARKRRETRQRIARAGLRMFLENGFDATTLDMIAAAADISRRTFFHYFDSKDDILTVWENEVADAFRTAIAEQPLRARPLAVVHGALMSVIARYETQEAVAIDRLMRSTEALRARKWSNYERYERTVFAAALAERWPGANQQQGLRLVAMLGVGALRLAVEKWAGNGYRGRLAKHLEEVFLNLRAQLTM
jgi:AcrR family transcriptional regulator